MATLMKSDAVAYEDPLVGYLKTMTLYYRDGTDEYTIAVSRGRGEVSTWHLTAADFHALSYLIHASLLPR